MSWTIDTSHTQVAFSARHMMIMNVRGSFEKFEGLVDFNQENPAASEIDVKIDASSLNTGDANRDAHLKSPDFLDAENYPSITFKSTRVEPKSESKGKVYGELTIRGMSKEVVLDVEYYGTAKSPWGTTNAGFSAQTKINRKDWGLTWNVALETGGLLVSEEITINLDVEIIKQAETEAVAA